MNDNAILPEGQRGFPGAEELDFELPEGFEKAPYREAGLQKYVNDKLGLELYVDHADPAQREYSDGSRFVLCEEVDDRCGSADPHIAGSDDFEDIRAEIEDYRARNSPSMGR